MANDNHDEHGRFASGDSGGGAHAAHANVVPGGKTARTFGMMMRGVKGASGTRAERQAAAELKLALREANLSD